MNHFYTALYPFINTIIEQYEFTRNEWEGAIQNQQEIMNMFADADEKSKIAYEFIKEAGLEDSFESYKKEFMADGEEE